MTDHANTALNRLVAVCRHGTGQGYKLRALLYSLWNGKPASLLEVRALDSQLKMDLLTVMAAFGSPNFDYDQIKSAFVRANLFDWFIEEGGQQ